MLYELETDERFEIWGGEKIMMVSGSEHSYITNNIARLVTNYVRKHKLGRVYDSNIGVFIHGDLANPDFRSPDLTFVSNDRLHIVQSKGIYGAPDLIVEVLSPGRANVERDRVEKFAQYESYGVKEYWIVDPFKEEVEIYVLNGANYARSEQSRVFPGIELPREEIFE